MNLLDKNLDMMNLVKDIPEDCAVFYFLTGPGDSADFLYAKGDPDLMSEALSNLMRQNEELEDIVRNAIIDFQDEE
jgi:hypothetical protein